MVEINGSTTGLEKFPENVSKSIQNTQSQLKDVDRLLKLDPSNTELVTQRQKLLADAISSTKEFLAAHKQAAEREDKQLCGDRITQEQDDALQREIIETEEALKKLEAQAKSTNITLA